MIDLSVLNVKDKIEIDEYYSFDTSYFEDTVIKKLDNVHAEGYFYLNASEEYAANIDISGVMILPDSVTMEDINYLIKKILNLRIFTDENDKMNYSISDINGDILLVPQFTLYANTKKGNRPSFENSLEPVKANELFELFKEEISKSGLNIQFGKFGSHMEINLTNNGPVTIIIDSKER